MPTANWQQARQALDRVLFAPNILRSESRELGKHFIFILTENQHQRHLVCKRASAHGAWHEIGITNARIEARSAALHSTPTEEA